MKEKGKNGRPATELKNAPLSVMDIAKELPAPASVKTFKLGKDCDYDRELRRLQIELVKLQEWIRQEKLRVVVLFEGRDAAGKGASPSRSTRAFAGWWPSARPLSVSSRSGISRDMSPICPLPERWFSSIAVGITAPASST